MSAADAVLKPDFAARRKHFIFTDEDEASCVPRLGFATKAAARRRGVETTFPDWGFTRMGELGFLGLDKPEEYGGQGGDYYSSLVLAEEIVHAQSGGLAMGVAVQTDMVMPPILAFSGSVSKQQWLVPAIRGEAILALGMTEPDAGSTWPASRPARSATATSTSSTVRTTYITNGHRAHVIVLVTKTDPYAGYDGFTSSSCRWTPPG